MSVLATTRINLAPTARTLASGVPLAPRINFAVGSSAAHDDGHGASAVRHDAPPKWASVSGRSMTLTRQNAPVTPIHSRRTIHSMASAIPNNKGSSSAHSVPDFKPYLAKSANSNRSLQYFMVGSMGLLAAAGAKATVTDILANMSASADVLALAKIEVEMASIPEGKNLIAKWRGKPVFIRHRTPDEIKEAESVDVKALRDPQTDADRVQQPEWLVMLGVCTHLGCVPIGEAGDYGGWFCPCHGSHYDISGRIRKGPAPLNLEVPEYSFSDDEKIIIG